MGDKNRKRAPRRAGHATLGERLAPWGRFLGGLGALLVGVAALVNVL